MFNLNNPLLKQVLTFFLSLFIIFSLVYPSFAQSSEGKGSTGTNVKKEDGKKPSTISKDSKNKTSSKKGAKNKEAEKRKQEEAARIEAEKDRLWQEYNRCYNYQRELAAYLNNRNNVPMPYEVDYQKERRYNEIMQEYNMVRNRCGEISIMLDKYR